MCHGADAESACKGFQAYEQVGRPGQQPGNELGTNSPHAHWTPCEFDNFASGAVYINMFQIVDIHIFMLVVGPEVFRACSFVAYKSIKATVAQFCR